MDRYKASDLDHFKIPFSMPIPDLLVLHIKGALRGLVWTNTASGRSLPMAALERMKYRLGVGKHFIAKKAQPPLSLRICRPKQDNDTF